MAGRRQCVAWTRCSPEPSDARAGPSDSSPDAVAQARDQELTWDEIGKLLDLSSSTAARRSSIKPGTRQTPGRRRTPRDMHMRAPPSRLRHDQFVDPSEPLLLRMFVDDVTGVGLWPDWDNDLDADRPEAELPITPDLRDRIRAWVDDYTQSIIVGPDWSPAESYDHDRTGYHLSEELQAQLGSNYRVHYKFSTEAARCELG